jgi:hypothetical protein
MATPLYFNYATLTTSGNSWHPWEQGLRENGVAKLTECGGELYGVWNPLFGLASNQVVVMTSWSVPDGVIQHVTETFMAVEGIVSVADHLVVPTSRPTTNAPPYKPGLYVHRWFLLESRHVDEAVALSATAWETFEHTFEVEIIGFFRTVEPQTELAELMLLTWYPTLAAWEKSRHAELTPEARTRFIRRRELSQVTRAIATSLEGAGSYLATRIS